jgi:hypothetical protein
MKKKKRSTPKKLSGMGDNYAQEVGLAVAPKLAIGALGIGALYFLLLKPVLEKTGVIETKEAAEAKKAEAQLATGTDSPFNPGFYKGKVGASLITKASAEALAKQIYDAVGNISDDENAVYAALRTLKAKTQLSFLSDVFTQKYAADLYQYLRRNFNDSEMAVVNSIANNLSGLNGFSGLNGLRLR